MMRLLAGAILAVALTALAAVAFAWSGTYDVSASAREWTPVRRLFASARDRSIDVRSDDVRRPAGFDPAARAEHGAEEYREMCPLCHGAPGEPPSAIRQGLNPAAPDLADDAVQRRYDDAELFWIVKHGIRMSGMPAFGATHDDATLWSIVAFLRRLPSLDAKSWAALGKDTGNEHAH